MAQCIIDDRGSFNLAAECRAQRDEFVAGTELVLDAREQVSLAVAGAGGAQKDAATGFLQRNREHAVKNFIRPSIHWFRMRSRQAAESFKQHFKRMFVGHGVERTAHANHARRQRISQEQRARNVFYRPKSSRLMDSLWHSVGALL
jgi:hypothetical protein